MFSKVIYFEGVACLGKTTLLKRLDSALYSVGLFDFAEYKEVTGSTDHVEYKLWHAKKKQEIHRGFVDRSPHSNNLYSFVYELLDNDLVKPPGFDERLRAVPNVRHPFEMTVIFLPANKESYEPIVKNMERRANGIDRLDVKYVEAQTIVFGDYAKFNNLVVVYLDFNLPIDKYYNQYNNLYSLMCAFMR